MDDELRDEDVNPALNTVPGTLEDLKVRVERMEKRQISTSTAVEQLQRGQTKNNAETSAILGKMAKIDTVLEMMENAEAGFKLLGWARKGVLWVAPLIGAFAVLNPHIRSWLPWWPWGK